MSFLSIFNCFIYVFVCARVSWVFLFGYTYFLFGFCMEIWIHNCLDMNMKMKKRIWTMNMKKKTFFGSENQSVLLWTLGTIQLSALTELGRTRIYIHSLWNWMIDFENILRYQTILETFRFIVFRQIMTMSRYFL